jgi:two-component sensor histidine kinase
VPLGLILNELVSNGLRHGFPEGQSGVITVDLLAGNQGRRALVVRDNGVGLPADFELVRCNSLGLRLVQLLAGQIGGELACQSRGGAEFKVSFPEKPIG